MYCGSVEFSLYEVEDFFSFFTDGCVCEAGPFWGIQACSVGICVEGFFDLGSTCIESRDDLF